MTRPQRRLAAPPPLPDSRYFLTWYRQSPVPSFRGHTAVVTLQLGDTEHAVSFTQRIVTRDGRVHYSGCAADSWEQAEASARQSLAQLSTDWHDDGSVQ